MAKTSVFLRRPLPPHGILAVCRPSGLRYGLSLLKAAQASFQVPRSDPNLPELYTIGTAISIERDDNLFPFFGWITERDISHGDPDVQIEARDQADAIFPSAITAKDWQPIEAASGEVLEAVFAEANGRAQPPLMVSWPTANVGLVVKYQAQAESIREFLDTLTHTGWEWGLGHTIGPESATTKLTWAARIGNDYRGKVTFEQGRDFVSASLRERSSMFISVGIAVGGEGPFATRPAVQVAISGVTPSGVDAQDFEGTPAPPPRSPALAGTRVLVDRQLSNKDALAQAARKLYTAPDFVAQQIAFSLAEEQVGPYSLSRLEVGGLYSVRFSDLILGLGYEANMRVIALAFGTEGIIEVEGQVV